MLKNIKIIIKIFSFLIIFLFLLFILSRGTIYEKNERVYGVTFSKKQAIDLGLDWKEVFSAMIDDLGVKRLRLAAYWDEVEPINNNYYWEDLDWQIDTASEKGVDIILAVGGRLPRWPECHFPDWQPSLTDNQKEEGVLEYIRKVVERYRDNQRIINWQVENEPFLPHFGECPKLNKDLLDKEISLVRSLDNRPIVVTDSGELSVWVPAAKRADIFGTTMYRDTYSEQLKRYVHYPIEPGFFRFKKNIARFFAKPEKWIVIELQGEPWGPKPFQYLSKAERDKTMNLEKFKEIIEFSGDTGFNEFYFWGVEWWYWEKEVQGDSRIWDEAKKLYLN